MQLIWIDHSLAYFIRPSTLEGTHWSFTTSGVVLMDRIDLISLIKTRALLFIRKRCTNFSVLQYPIKNRRLTSTNLSTQTIEHSSKSVNTQISTHSKNALTPQPPCTTISDRSPPRTNSLTVFLQLDIHISRPAKLLTQRPILLSVHNLHLDWSVAQRKNSPSNQDDLLWSGSPLLSASQKCIHHNQF
jgi:hypothetical protein